MEGTGDERRGGMSKEGHLMEETNEKSPGRNRRIGHRMKARRCTAPPRYSVCASSRMARGHMEPRMNYRLGLRSWAAGAVVLAAVTACSNSGTDPGAEPTTTSPTTSSLSGLPTSPSESAADDAATLVRRYLAVLDEARTTPTSPLAELKTVAIGTQLAAQTRLVKNGRQRGLRQVGSTRIVQLKVQSVDLENSDPSVGKVPTAAVDICWDVSGADLQDERGQSVVSPQRADRGWTRYTVANYHWSQNPTDGWRIASSQDLKQSPCAAS